MDDETKFAIDRILHPVRSIHDLSRRTISELVGTLAGRFVVEKFTISPSDWLNWKSRKEEVRNIEYDAKTRRLIIKAVPSHLHGTASVVMQEWCILAAQELREATKTKFKCSRNLGHVLSGKHPETFLSPDMCIHRRTKKFPLVIVEVAVSESTTQVFRNVEKFLDGSNGQTRLAIVVDITEHHTIKPNSPYNWELSTAGISDLPSNELAEHILCWHSKEGIHFLGYFTACVYLRFQDQDWQSIWGYGFSVDRPVTVPSAYGTQYITTKDLLPEIDDPVTLPFPLEMLARELEECLGAYEFQKAMVQADMRQKKLVEESMQVAA